MCQCVPRDVTVDDPRWVGAWWILYIVTGLMAIAIVLPILSFPAEMAGKSTSYHWDYVCVHEWLTD